MRFKQYPCNGARSGLTLRSVNLAHYFPASRSSLPRSPHTDSVWSSISVALGRGGLSADPMWEQREADVRALHPRLIRLLIIQEYFDRLPAPGRTHFATLDQSVDLILYTGATPLLPIAFRPKLLLPRRGTA
jgi:hypothetical protein